MKINILDKKVYNRIAAGEVVERPFSVIKELVENSIDAGSKNINVSIWNGGKDRMTIEDDGCGIEKEELEKAFMPHATSKISDIGDLDKILTLGFRGEALASIASVAKVDIVSKPKAQEFGAKISSEGGVVSDVTDAASKDGTKITVDNLFFNTPVRAKFLKSAKSEEGDITNIIGRLIIANPFISFTYYVDDKLVLQSFGGGEEEALISVYGANTVKNCFRIETVKNGIGISGYIGKHNFTKPNRTYQTLIINGRYIINTTVSSAVQNAYQSYLMKRQYPFYALTLTVPAEAVDVNVHPNKTDVRFSNNQVIYGAVYSVISKVLDGTNEALEIVKESFNDMPLNVDSNEILIDKSQDFNVSNFSESDKKSVRIGLEYGDVKDDFYPATSKLMDSGVLEEREDAADKDKDKLLDDIFLENKKFIAEMERKSSIAEDFDSPEIPLVEESKNIKNNLGNIKADLIEEKTCKPTQFDMGIEHDFLYVGQTMKTYLIFEKNGDLYFIDQHAAHERVLFDALYEKSLNGKKETQPLLIPYILNLNTVEGGYFENRRQYLTDIGFGIEDFGRDSYKITEVPLELADISLDMFFGDILSDNSLKQEKMSETIREKLCQKACKAAIKAGYDLSKQEIDSLMRKINGNMGLKCPHGRPVAVRITGTEIEKWFKRIV